MELLKQSYDSILAIPVTRRYRLIMRKDSLERKREDNARAEASRARARASRRR